MTEKVYDSHHVLILKVRDQKAHDALQQMRFKLKKDILKIIKRLLIFKSLSLPSGSMYFIET